MPYQFNDLKLTLMNHIKYTHGTIEELTSDYCTLTLYNANQVRVYSVTLSYSDAAQAMTDYNNITLIGITL